uniref:Homeobox domain-containing protein n=1 Tax=Opuntia streptacantha TaxID=393608 RepID=A0A7C8YSE0_OPUST
MGRPPSNGAPAFRFNQTEVAQMEAVLREHEGQIPARELLVALAEKFSNSSERAGKVTVQMKQVWNWFQNRRYALRSKLVKSPGKLNVSTMPREEVTPVRNVPPVPQGPPQIPVPSGPMVVRSTSETPQMEFEAKSARDGAWYDVQAFLSHRYLETGNPEVLVRFAGFGPEEDEWVNVGKHVRQRSLPCESSECVAVLPGDLILCFQEGKEQALYFDAHVLDAQRRRHDIRGCRCRFLVRYDHDQSEEIVPLRKVCRRPETDYRLQQLHAANESASASPSVSLDPQKPAAVDPSSSITLRVIKSNPSSAAVVAPVPSISAAGPPASASASVTASAPTPTPNPTPTPASAFSAAPAPVPVLVSVPETNKAEGNNSGVSESGATARENVTSVVDGNVALEAKNSESISLETAALAGSNPLLGQVNGNPTTAAAVLEKSDINNSGHPDLLSGSATVASTAPVSTANTTN